MPLPRYIVWWKVGKENIQIGHFYHRCLAETFANCQREKYKGERFKVMPVGETPVWD